MTWIPPISLSESVKEIYQNFKSKEGRKNLGKKALFAGAIMPLGICLGFGALYGIIASDKRNWDYKKWSEIEEQRNLEKQIKQQNLYRNEFKTLDKNKDYVLDSTEFIKFYKEKK